MTTYVQLVVERDVLELSRIKQRDRLPQLLRALAAQTAQLLRVRHAGKVSGLEVSTAENYAKLLEAAFLVHRLPAWGKTLRSRIGSTPRLHVFDTGLGARLLGLTAEKLARRQPQALSEFGHLLETFVVNEILKQISWGDRRIDSGHFRTKAGAEVDLVLESDEGQVLGIEVKSSSRVTSADFSGLRELREVAGDAFVAGVVFHPGERSFSVEPGLIALPIDRLWAAGLKSSADSTGEIGDQIE